jgi:hypothetical protein
MERRFREPPVQHSVLKRGGALFVGPNGVRPWASAARPYLLWRLFYAMKHAHLLQPLFCNIALS